MTITELINLGNKFEWIYQQMYHSDGKALDIISEDKIVSNEEDYISWLCKVKRMFQKEYSTDAIFDEIIDLTSSQKPNTYSKHMQIMGVLRSIEDDPQLCNKVESMSFIPAVNINNNINIGITLNSITEGLTPQQLAELKYYIKSNPKDKEGFVKKLLSLGVDATTILSNILGAEPIWNAITNLLSK